ncbi:MAG TPA: glycoside hydrolase family 3 C-terminal domain-containing protein [Planctomycetota bacterium]|nr:glycoside hydrolase family 3 C-terminal domain-containing protein [Planctomycetota bacterium]
MNLKRDPRTERQIDALLAKLGPREKVALLSGRDSWHTVAVERLGIRSLVMTDGPHGVRACSPETGRKQGPATVFPNGVSFAASWNPELVGKVGRALAEEARALGCDILLGPCINIARTPLAGRNFETYAEDPFLAGRLAVSYVRGVQSRGVGTSLKHFACNNQENQRWRGSSVVDERTLREIYLPAFEATVKEAQPWTVMCAYNRVNGVYASQNRKLLTEILRDEWGFQGAVVSDWGANHTSIESVQAGLDIEMPGPALYFGRLLAEGVETWQIEEPVLDAAVRRILRLVLRCERKASFKGSANTPAHARLARELAEESITLLKNDGGVLPLVRGKVGSVAVIGRNAREISIQGGGSAHGEPPRVAQPLAALRERLKGRARVGFAPGYDVGTRIFSTDEFGTVKGRRAGLRTEVFTNTKFSGRPAVVRTDSSIDFWISGNRTFLPGVTGADYSIRWTGRIGAEHSGVYRFTMTHVGAVRWFLDGRALALKRWTSAGAGSDEKSRAMVEVRLEAGRSRDLRVEYVKTGAEDISHLRVFVERLPSERDEALLRQAAELARRSDVAVVFAGLSALDETEGRDRPHMDLPAHQNALIRAVAAANPRTVVVLGVGAPVTMPWLDEVAGLVLAYYPGQEGGEALARVLVGEVNPSGRLPVTFPKRYEDNPTFLHYPGTREAFYGEGVFVGYRYYDRKGVEPLFPFGFGLSYTEFEYRGLKIPRAVRIGATVPVEVTVTNVGRVAGKETVQLYVSDPEATLPRPVKELKAFRKVALRPGQSRRVRFELDSRAFAFYDPYAKRWTVEPGRFEILVGSSSCDIRLRRGLEMRTGAGV